MFRHFIFKSVLSALILLISVVSWAGKVPGYIIVNDTDTVKGEIKTLGISINSGAAVIAGIDLESYYYSVLFKSETDKQFKTYTGADIAGFSFIVKSIVYHFKSFKVESKGVSRKERERYRFYNLLLSAEVKLYRYAESKPINSTQDYLYGQPAVYYNLYLFSEAKGLKQVVKSNDFKTLTSLLRYYEFDEAFLRELPRRTKFKYVKDVLIDYEHWKAKNYIST